MHERRLRILSVLTASFLLATLVPDTAQASTVAPPRDLGHLARLSDAVVFAQAIDSRVDEGGNLPYTITRFQLLEAVAGAETGLIFEVGEPGGSGTRRAAVVAGAPRFEAGRNYLLFLERAPADRWRSKMLAYGLLEEAPNTRLLRPLPEAGRIELVTKVSREPVGVYRKDALLQHLRDVARGRAAWDLRKVEALSSEAAPLVATGESYTAPTSCAFLTHSDGVPIRWFNFETGATASQIMATTPGQNGIADGGVSAVQQGTASWTNHADSAIRLLYTGTRASNISCSGQFDQDLGGVVFNDPCDDIANLSGCSGTLAFGGPFFSLSTTNHDGQPWHAATDSFVVVNNGAECVGENNFREVLAHELGHTLGFGHHNPPNPADALMSPSLKGGTGATLRSVDRSCASFAYHTFFDVPTSQPFWSFIEAVENAGITTGCGAAAYCPSSLVTRAEMAAFLERGIHGGSYVPPAPTGRVFSDVPASYWAAGYIEQLQREGITNGCGPGVYCPDGLVRRAEMAAFLVRVRHGSNFTPPPATGIFQDVPASYWAAAYIEQLYNDGITIGCASNPLRFCPETNVSREEMAAFLARTFSLPLP